MTPSIINEIIGPIIVGVLAFYGFTSFWFDVYSKLKKKTRGVPNLRNIPPLPLPIQRYRQPTPTIETQYGRDLLRVSTEIFIKNLDSKMNPEDMAQCSVLSALNLLSEVGEVCHKKDKQKQKEQDDRSKEQAQDYFKRRESEK